MYLISSTELEKTKERSPSPTDSSSSVSLKEAKGLLTTGATKVKKKKKSVTWKEDHEIKEIFYFEMDEDERGNYGNQVPLLILSLFVCLFYTFLCHLKRRHIGITFVGGGGIGGVIVGVRISLSGA